MASIYYSDMLLLFILLLISGVVFVYRRRLPVTNWPVLGMTPEILLNCHRIHDFFTNLVKLSNATFLLKDYDPERLSIDLPFIPCEKAFTDVEEAILWRHVLQKSLAVAKGDFGIGKEKDDD
ncbi:alkane hydroxylase MAH1-like protein [Tanacetum coccineum]